MTFSNSAAVRAPLRWAGSKRKSLKSLFELMPDDFSNYIEPFAGSACLVFCTRPTNIVLGDINPQLVEFYHYLREDPENLHSAYIAIPANPNHYYDVRRRYNEATPSLERAAQFLYLNRHCFNGIYRVNRKGDFNVPWGGDKTGRPLTSDDLINASKVLEGAQITCGDFETIVDNSLVERSFVYLDPPYATNEARVFREYHQESFAMTDWDRLDTLLVEIDQRGAFFLLSYAGDETFAKRLSRWKVGQIDVTRNVGGFRATRRKHREIVATNY